MYIDDRLLLVKPPLSQEQRNILAHDEGPLLIIAGPGSGKTHSIIRRAVNILLQGKAEPSQLILCTHTDKAANEMRSRFMALAQEVGYQEDLSQLHIGTIHSICNQLVTEYRHLAKEQIGNDYTILDEFTQRLFIFQHLTTIDKKGFFCNKWQNQKWHVAKQLQEYFDKIMEELIEPKRLFEDTNPYSFLQNIGIAYNEYRHLLIANNCVSYAAQLKIVYNLLYNNPKASDQITRKFRYVFVDEYQDTNLIQEKIVCRLASFTRNLCVVGDEDQGLYRFRGATVQNILEFKHNTSDCQELLLTTNYRSHKEIIIRYDTWMKSHDWSNNNPAKVPFRRDKTIMHDREKVYHAHPAVICIDGQTLENEAEQLAELILFLKTQQIISDYNQIAFLLASVKPHYSKVYIEVLRQKNIPFFCPRARLYFSYEEVRLLVACFAQLLDYKGVLENDLLDHEGFAKYITKDCLKLFDMSCPQEHPLQMLLRTCYEEMMDTTIQRDAHISLTDCFYRLLAVEPFTSFAQSEQSMHNLVIFSKVLKTFQNFYKHTHITQETYEKVRHDFFHIFLRLLEDGGKNEYEDVEQPFPKGHVQIMTIHQAKGLEFPVVIVGSLSKGHNGAQEVDRVLKTVNDREEFEQENRIPGFDMMRLYYVAFSRAEHLLVIMNNRYEKTHPKFATMMHNLPCWPTIRQELTSLPLLKTKTPIPTKHRYSLTGHIQMYETCPRKYLYFHEYNFVSSQQREVFLGLLVHNTLEEIHRQVKHDRHALTNEVVIQTVVDKVYCNLLHKHNEPIDMIGTKQEAYTQVWNYVRQNFIDMHHIIDIEVDVPIEKEGYILTGRIDVLRERDGVLELVDFKTEHRPEPDDARLIDYERQLCIYASALEKRRKMRPERLILYWTGEERREDAIMTFWYNSEKVERVERSVDSVVANIKEKKFHIDAPPDDCRVCKGCDIQHICINEGVIKPFVTVR